jgi:DeoR/GlpR family transcriptional regulator of sugar metabolism
MRIQTAVLDVRSRRELSLYLLQMNGQVSVTELSARAGVSEMTIRRDLEALEREGLVKRVHGGAISSVSRGYEPPFAIRANRNIEKKERVAGKVVSLLSEGETVILDVGTTVLEVARALNGRGNLTVLTPSLRVAQLLGDDPGIRLMVTGGLARPGELSLIGSLAENAFAEFRFDTFVMGVGGVDADAGVTEYNPDDARVKRAALASARRRIVATDSSKIGKVTFARICPLEQIDILVTDTDATEEMLTPIQAADVQVVIA